MSASSGTITGTMICLRSFPKFSIDDGLEPNILIPYQRLLASPELNAKVKREFTGRYTSYNPLDLQMDVHKVVDILISLNIGKELEVLQPLAAAPFKPSSYG